MIPGHGNERCNKKEDLNKKDITVLSNWVKLIPGFYRYKVDKDLYFEICIVDSVPITNDSSANLNIVVYDEKGRFYGRANLLYYVPITLCLESVERLLKNKSNKRFKDISDRLNNLNNLTKEGSNDD